MDEDFLQDMKILHWNRNFYSQNMRLRDTIKVQNGKNRNYFRWLVFANTFSHFRSLRDTLGLTEHNELSNLCDKIAPSWECNPMWQLRKKQLALHEKPEGKKLKKNADYKYQRRKYAWPKLQPQTRPRKIPSVPLSTSLMNTIRCNPSGGLMQPPDHLTFHWITGCCIG